MTTDDRPDRQFYLMDKALGEEFIWEADGYRTIDDKGQEQWMILFVCPLCNHELRLESTKKPIQVTKAGLETGEPIRCTWQNEADRFTGHCTFAAELHPPRKPLQGPVRCHDGRVVHVRVDAIIRRI